MGCSLVGPGRHVNQEALETVALCAFGACAVNNWLRKQQTEWGFSSSFFWLIIWWVNWYSTVQNLSQSVDLVYCDHEWTAAHIGDRIFVLLELWSCHLLGRLPSTIARSSERLVQSSERDVCKLRHVLSSYSCSSKASGSLLSWCASVGCPCGGHERIHP